MPRLTRALKDARKAKEEALKASETSTSGINNDITTSSAAAQYKISEKSMGEIGKERSDGGERGPGGKTQQKVIEVNAFTVVPDKKAENKRAEIAKERSSGGEGGPSRKSGEEETVSLRPSQLESKQKRREERSSFAGNKGFGQDLNDRSSNTSQNYGGYNSGQGGQHGYYENLWSGRGGYNEGNSRRIDALGRALSGILRHKAPQLGLKIRSDGYVVVKDLLSLHTKTSAGLPLNAHSVDDLKEAVKRDTKQRFGLCEENGQLLIRANQGHSLEIINSADLLKQVLSHEEVPVCMHGTCMKYLESIRKEGLKRMTRNHVHFATGYFRQNGVISGDDDGEDDEDEDDDDDEDLARGRHERSRDSVRGGRATSGSHSGRLLRSSRGGRAEPSCSPPQGRKAPSISASIPMGNTPISRDQGKKIAVGSPLRAAPSSSGRSCPRCSIIDMQVDQLTLDKQELVRQVEMYQIGRKFLDRQHEALRRDLDAAEERNQMLARELDRSIGDVHEMCSMRNIYMSMYFAVVPVDRLVEYVPGPRPTRASTTVGPCSTQPVDTHHLAGSTLLSDEESPVAFDTQIGCD